MKVSAKLNNIRIAPRKTRLVANLIKGLDVDEAINQLNSTVKGGCEPFLKLLQSAVANGENNFGIDKANMFVFNALVNEGPVLKRWKPRAFGRAGRILKRTSKIELILEERVEGKGRKTKEQLEQERKSREEKRKKEMKQLEKDQDAKEKETVKKKEVKQEKDNNELRSKENKGSWTNKIFRRKSM